MTISDALRKKIRDTFDNRCAYCLSSQQYLMWVLEIDHIKPVSKSGSDEEDNLCLCCRSCNLYKSNQTHAVDPDSQKITSLFNPRTDEWVEHFRWSKDGTRVIGLTPIGRVTVNALQLNNEVAILTRSNWVDVGWHPPK